MTTHENMTAPVTRWEKKGKTKRIKDSSHQIIKLFFWPFVALLSSGCKVKLTQHQEFWLRFGLVPAEGAVA